MKRRYFVPKRDILIDSTEDKSPIARAMSNEDWMKEAFVHDDCLIYSKPTQQVRINFGGKLRSWCKDYYIWITTLESGVSHPPEEIHIILDFEINTLEIIGSNDKGLLTTDEHIILKAIKGRCDLGLPTTYDSILDMVKKKLSIQRISPAFAYKETKAIMEELVNLGFVADNDETGTNHQTTEIAKNYLLKNPWVSNLEGGFISE